MVSFRKEPIEILKGLKEPLSYIERFQSGMAERGELLYLTA